MKERNIQMRNVNNKDELTTAAKEIIMYIADSEEQNVYRRI